MRVLRAVYNEAVMEEVATYKPYIFNKVYTGVEANRENALEADVMKRLIQIALNRRALLRPSLQLSLQYFVLMFMHRGLPFVDLSFMKMSIKETFHLLYIFPIYAPQISDNRNIFLHYPPLKPLCVERNCQKITIKPCCLQEKIQSEYTRAYRSRV